MKDTNALDVVVLSLRIIERVAYGLSILQEEGVATDTAIGRGCVVKFPHRRASWAQSIRMM